jgi:hypothetical protein
MLMATVVKMVGKQLKNIEEIRAYMYVKVHTN